MNVMFGYALSRRLADTRIMVNGGHPGIVKQSGLGRHMRGALKVFTRLLTPRLARHRTEELTGVSGRYFVRRKEVGTASHTTDVARRDRLWDESARLVGLPAALS